MFGYHPGDKVCFLSVAHFTVCHDFQADLFEDAWKICLSSPGMIVWAVHLLPVSCLNITERNLTPSRKKKGWKRPGVQVQISKILVRTAKGSFEILINYYCHCTFSQDTISMKRHTSFQPLKFKGFEFFSATEACMTCKLSCRCDLLWNEEICGVFPFCFMCG